MHLRHILSKETPNLIGVKKDKGTASKWVDPLIHMYYFVGTKADTWQEMRALGAPGLPQRRNFAAART